MIVHTEDTTSWQSNYIINNTNFLRHNQLFNMYLVHAQYYYLNIWYI